MHPERIGPYHIEKKIGSGGMGTVYYGRHTETGQVAAVKVLPPSMAHEEGFVARFFREVEALKKLVNPHVVQLYESGGDGDTYYYAMEYVDGDTLTGILRRERRIDWRRTIGIAVQICSALKAAHDAGIIHRDLKPSNLLIASDGTVKLTDFGVAQVFAGTRLTVTGGVIGTAEYMSPEQAQGQRATKKSDLYSLGAVMYVMLTGRPPFTGKTSVEVIHKHQYGQFDRPRTVVPEIPYWLDEIVVQLLDKDPDKRFADAHVLSRRLQEVVKKIELSRQDVTRASSGYNEDASTVAVQDSLHAAAYSGPGEGTIMRDLVRTEISRAQHKSPVGEFFNNTWVLVVMLLIVVGGGIAWFILPRSATPAEESADDSDEVGRRRVVRIYRPGDEAQTFLQLAQHSIDVGRFDEAQRKLEALCALTEGQPDQKKTYDKARRLLEVVRESRANVHTRHALLDAAIRQAEELAQRGKRDEAIKIWSSIVELYGADPDVKPAIEKVRGYLQQPADVNASKPPNAPGGDADESKR